MVIVSKVYKYTLFIIVIASFPRAETMLCSNIFRENLVTIYRGLNIHPKDFDVSYDVNNLGKGVREEVVWFSENFGTAELFAKKR